MTHERFWRSPIPGIIFAVSLAVAFTVVASLTALIAANVVHLLGR